MNLLHFSSSNHFNLKASLIPLARFALCHKLKIRTTILQIPFVTYPSMVNLNDSERFAIYAGLDIITWTTCSMTMSILGVLMNIYTIAIVLMNKEFRKSHYILLLGTSISDLICDTIFIPIETLQSYYIIYTFKPLGDDFFCSIEGCGYAIFFSASIISQMLICGNRLLAVFAPIFYQSKVNVKMALISWLIASIGYPTFYHLVGLFGGWVSFPIDMWAGDCLEKDITPVLREVRITTNMYFPMTFTLLGYIVIMARIIFTTSKDKRANLMERAKGSMAMFASMLFYSFCVLPLWISFSSDSYGDSLWRTLWIKFLFRSSYAINPVSAVIF